MSPEESINYQIQQKLLIFNEDLKKKKGNHHLEYFSWIAIACLVAYVALQIIRWRFYNVAF